ncbi:MAG TPA: hypothetical protein VJ914_24555 [Pseudonocardiaceae bacterium]|nr:hypothetical protein [Pseudonocardiaceae bacterium]
MSTPEPAKSAPPQRPLPLVNARTWAIGFLVFGVVLSIVLSQTMVGFLHAAYASH